jgi:hypothetical protein
MKNKGPEAKFLDGEMKHIRAIYTSAQPQNAIKVPSFPVALNAINYTI